MKLVNKLLTKSLGVIVLLMYSGIDKDQINFYEKQTAEISWSRNVLLMQIETKLYKRKGAAVISFDKKLQLPQSDLAQFTLINPYVFDFLSLGDKAQKGLVRHKEKFLLVLGEGAAFLGSQYHL